MSNDEQGPAIDPEQARAADADAQAALSELRRYLAARSHRTAGEEAMARRVDAAIRWALARDAEASRLAVRIHPCEQHRDEVMKGGECPWHTIERLEQEVEAHRKMLLELWPVIGSEERDPGDAWPTLQAHLDRFKLLHWCRNGAYGYPTAEEAAACECMECDLESCPLKDGQ